MAKIVISEEKIYMAVAAKAPIVGKPFFCCSAEMKRGLKGMTAKFYGRFTPPVISTHEMGNGIYYVNTNIGTFIAKVGNVNEDIDKVYMAVAAKAPVVGKDYSCYKLKCGNGYKKISPLSCLLGDECNDKVKIAQNLCDSFYYVVTENGAFVVNVCDTSN